jgi:DNA-binding response OmpR family regulator
MADREEPLVDLNGSGIVAKASASVLIIDDEPHIARLLEFILAEAGYRVTVVASGEEALELLERQIFKAILLDLSLPGLSGLDVLRQIRCDDRHNGLRVIVLTARASVDVSMEVLEAGADAHCTKPIAPTLLLHQFRQLVGPAHAGAQSC